MNFNLNKASFSRLPRPTKWAVVLASALIPASLIVLFWTQVKQALIFAMILIFLLGFAAYNFTLRHALPLLVCLLTLSALGSIALVVKQLKSGQTSLLKVVLRQTFKAAVLSATVVFAAVLVWVFFHPAGLLPGIR